MDDVFDVAVIGAGVVGAAIARELSRYELKCALVEARSDVGMGTSQANTAIWHTGYDAKPGSLEARLVRRSDALLREYVPQAGVPHEHLGGLLVAWTEDQRQALPALLDKAHQNGEADVRVVSAEEVHQREPRLAAGALGGLWVPGESIFCPYTLTLALATQAVVNQTALYLERPIAAITQEPDGTYTLAGPGGALRCRYIVNAAGLYSDVIDRLLGHADFTVTPRRGELIVFDKFSRSLVNHIVLPVPTAITKGVLISPTVYGNVMLGPTAEDLRDKTDTGTSAGGLHSLWQKGAAILPALLEEEVTATYAGLRAATEHSDYQIRLHAGQRYVCVGGIRSTGVSGCLGIAEYVAELLQEAGLRLTAKAEFKPVRMANIGEAAPRPYQSADRIAADPAYGQIVCHCERVTLGEVCDAARSVIPARTLDGLRRRTRALQGRCQGFNCQAALVTLLAQEAQQTPERLLQLEASHAG
ncbi:MAG: NAD(P)/FAD-dependent oxidoreductase [Anaerolineales bacterium]|nr:NAD(P)/FAD-dependent oxidoreductase [Anaerolineales bacterium]